MTDIFSLPVHPAADVFPMLDNDELSDLAADIKANGLQHPIVIGEVDGVEMLIDGRNRLAACKLAGVEPEVKQLNGHDPEALILSENIMRRHMTKGQRAMAVAMMYPEGAKGGRGKTSDILSGLSSYMVKQVGIARTVLKYAPEYTESVLAGAKSLSEAYEEAKQRKSAGNDDTAKLEWLKSIAPDLADKVVEGDLTLVGAIAEHNERERQKAMERAALAATLREASALATALKTDANRKSVISLITEFPADYEKATSQQVADFISSLDLLEQGIQSIRNEIGGR